MASFPPRDLYGGAVTAPLPSDYLDASTLRQIPDHQEVFLSPRTLTSLVFEINQYVAPSATTTTDPHPGISSPAGGAADPPSQGTVEGNEYDRAAVLYHLRDLLDAHDTLTGLSAPRRVSLQSPSLSAAPAFVVQATLTTRENKARRSRSMLPEEDRQVVPGDDGAEMSTTTTIRLLVVRLEAHATDLCVAVNVPWKELGRAVGEGNGAVEREEAFAQSLLESLLAGLHVRDFALFAG